MPRVEKVPTAPFNPFYGCAIMVMAVLVFGGIIGWSAWSLFQQDKAISRFAEDQPRTLAPIELKADERQQLEAKLSQWAQKLNSGEKAELSLTVNELNALLVIAPDSGYGSYVDMLRVVAFDPANVAVKANVALPMNRIRFWEGKKRYLNGDVKLSIYANEEGVDARVADAKVPGKEVPEGFVKNLGTWTLLGPYRSQEAIAAVIKKVRKVTVKADELILSP